MSRYELDANTLSYTTYKQFKSFVVKFQRVYTTVNTPDL